MKTDFTLPIDIPGTRRFAARWLILGVAALTASGVFSILLVLFRTPHVQDLVPGIDFFRIALVVHVDLSVLIWFLAFAGVLWSLSSRTGVWQSIALGLACAGTAIITFGPFAGVGDPLMNNYIPVLDHPAFFTGLGLFGAGMLVLLGNTLICEASAFKSADGHNVLRTATFTAALTAVMAAVSFSWSYLAMPEGVSGETYYEYLFWGGGHVLQFTYTLLMLAAWLWLAGILGLRFPFGGKTVIFLLILGALPVLYAPIIHLSHEVLSPGYRLGFASLMKYGNGLAAVPVGLAILYALARGTGPVAEHNKPLRAALISSVLLFGAGGIISFFIAGTNTIIPAHYHGSIVGVTLAFMGLTYYLLPKLGYRPLKGAMANIQPYLYGGGQALHITGLALAGAMGIQRKTAGSAQGLKSLTEQILMGLMGLGGLIAIIGGLLFVIVTIRAIWPAKQS
ncbi:MAG: cbb3-type cytochrome c oxidase subunit I [Gammaproteobacteria bacterium]|nr:cbb3-type cytochrome c oxidase subunit I [Gammaproteobacteria bacterium]